MNIETIDWDLSERLYWAEHVSYADQVAKTQLIAKQERRQEMRWGERLLDYALECFFPRRYALFYYCHTQRPPMHLFNRNDSAAKLLVRAPLPRLIPRATRCHFADF